MTGNRKTPGDAVKSGEADQPSYRTQVDVQEVIDDDQWVQVNQVHYDYESDRSLVTALVLAIAEAKGVDPIADEEMPPLFESLDAAALENMFFSSAEMSTDDKGFVTFRYTEYKVVLRADGWIFVYWPR